MYTSYSQPPIFLIATLCAELQMSIFSHIGARISESLGVHVPVFVAEYPNVCSLRNMHPCKSVLRPRVRVCVFVYKSKRRPALRKNILVQMSFKDGWTRTGFFKVKLIYCNRSFVFAETEVSKTVDMYLFLFDDILLLTKVKKQPRKVRI